MAAPKFIFGFVCAALLARMFPALPVPAEASDFASVQRALGIPDSQATVSDAWLDPSHAMPEFVLIQDAHRHPEVQNRVAWIVLHGYSRWGVRKVFIEGAFAPVDLSMFHVLNDGERAALSDHLVKRGELSGPERAGLQIAEREWRNPPVSPFQVIGMEEPAVYRANISAYRQVLASRRKALRAVDHLDRLHQELGLPGDHPLRQQLDLLVRLIQLRVSPAEFAKYQNGRHLIPSMPAIDTAREAAERFYQLVDQRSQVFVAQAQRRSPAAPGPRILVVGGFHSAAMAEMLRKARKPFVVLTPLATQPASDALYQRRLYESTSIF